MKDSFDGGIQQTDSQMKGRTLFAAPKERRMLGAVHGALLGQDALLGASYVWQRMWRFLGFQAPGGFNNLNNFEDSKSIGAAVTSCLLFGLSVAWGGICKVDPERKGPARRCLHCGFNQLFKKRK